MSNKFWLMNTAAAILALPAMANAQGAAPTTEASAQERSDIIVTATRRSVGLSDVALSVSAVSGEALQNSGVSDIRALNQLSPSLLVSSSQSEAAGGTARIRGVGTVGDNPGLESSVATFVDGVYRNRSGVAMAELGAIDRIEVLRGPQGTLFGRNASAGLINIITKAPSFTEEGTAELGYGNYDAMRAVVGLTGPVGKSSAYRIDGVISKRDGFLQESGNYTGASGRKFNDRDRWLLRGQLLNELSETLSLRLVADYAKRNEQCCAATFLPANQTALVGGQIVSQPNAFAGLERTLGAVINDNTFGQKVAVTPGRDYRSDVREWGVSAEANWDLGDAKLTSISAYRNWQLKRATDADFTNLDLLYRDGYNQHFKTLTQELRLQGKALDGNLDWLVGAYYADETLNLSDNIRFGRDYGTLQGCRIVAGAMAALGLPSITLSPASAGCINPLVRPAIAASFSAPAQPAVTALLSTIDRLRAIGDSGASNDHFTQKDRTWALFTHNEYKLTDALSLTLGARYTHDRKSLAATVASDTSVCLQQAAVLTPLMTQISGAAALGVIPAATAATLNGLAANIRALSCANNIGGGVDGAYADRVSDKEWSGTAVLSYKPTDRLMTYASYSKGFKAGGFNLDRAGLAVGAPNAASLRFGAETVDAWELGAKYRGHGFRLAASAFYQMFDDFQLNGFNGLNYSVENIEGCSSLNGGANADSDLSGTTGSCGGKAKAGVISKGVELEGNFYPTDALSLDVGYTYADTRYADDIAGRNGAALPATLFLLPGQNLSNAPKQTVTAGATWTPAIGNKGWTALVHADVRHQSGINTGSDLFPEKLQEPVTITNARIGINGADKAWGIELWAQNLFDVDYRQVVAGAPIQGSNSVATIKAGGATVADSLFIVFPAEPRTWGLTVKTKF